jgi:hypothetical protein
VAGAHRTVSGAPEESGFELASFGNPLRYNSPNMSGEPAEQRLLRANGRLQRIKCAPARAEEQSTRGWHTGQSTGLVRCTTGQPGGPTRQSSNGRNPTAYDVAGAPDCPVRHATAASTKRLVWWLGL